VDFAYSAFVPVARVDPVARFFRSVPAAIAVGFVPFDFPIRQRLEI
jgi:hypothetical protein